MPRLLPASPLASPPRPRRSLGLLLGALLLAPSADAAEPPPPLPERAAAPTVHTIGFVDRPGDQDCDDLDARWGRCIEWVDLLDVPSLYVGAAPNSLGPPLQSDGERVAMGRNISDLHVELWQGTAWRWDRDGDAWTLTAGREYRTPPAAAALFDAGMPTPDERQSLPDRGAWLDSSFWGLGAKASDAGATRRLATLSPVGSPPIPDSVLLRGRTADRLGFSGKAHPWDLMDANPTSSAPFFEQIFPYSMGMESNDPRIRPLVRFAMPLPPPSPSETPAERAALEADVHRALLLHAESSAALTTAARREFDSFFRAVGLHLIRFGLHDYTVNHMRILGAITQMAFPPASDHRGRPGGRSLVAASLGETDLDKDVETRVDRGAGAMLDADLRVRYEQLPEAVVRLWVDRLAGEQLPEGFLVRWNRSVDDVFDDLLVSGHVGLDGTGLSAMQRWAAQNVRPGLDPAPVLLDIGRLALRHLVTDAPPGGTAEERAQRAVERDRVETWLLLDHVHHAIASSMTATTGSPVTPDEAVGAATAHWQAVLSTHGNFPAPISQGLGAVDPLSVCTTSDGRKALSEATIRPVEIDLLAVAASGLRSVEEVVWAARDQLPFLAIDDPWRTPPTLTALVDLPRGRTVYRLRYTVWSGWHLLWSAATLADGSRSRLVGRTAAFCDDSVLAPPDLVPTLIRAALLDGELSPSWPVRPGSPQDRKDALPPPAAPEGGDEAVGEAQAQADAAAEKATAAKEQATKVKEGGAAGALDVARAAVAGLGPGEAEALVQRPVGPRTDYLRGLIRPHLERLATAERGNVLLVYDTTARAQPPASDLKARTPYVRTSRRDAGLSVHTAGWGFWLDEAGGPALLVAPHFRPSDSATTDSPTPTWSRQNLTDGFLVLGGGVSPYRMAAWTCGGDAVDPAVAACADKGLITQSPALSFDMAITMSLWRLTRTPAAFEFGPEVRLDIGLPGVATATTPGSFGTVFTFRPAAGLVIGGRFLPAPAGRFLPRGVGWPWGAERSDGVAHLERVAFGVRAGLLLGAGFGGVDATVLGEWWLGGAIRRPDGPRAAITPFRPGTLIGPYARFSVTFPAAPDDGTRLLRSTSAIAATVGVRFHLRMQAPTLLSAPEVK